MRSYTTKSKNAQEAHEAIRPTHTTKRNAGNNDDEKRLYDLIWRRTVSSQMKDAQTLRTKVVVEIGGGEKKSGVPDFAINGSRVTYDGWLIADPQSRGDDTEVPELKVKETLTLKDIHSEEKNTEPPNRYSEAGLIKELEKRGIGRPSTYASILKTIEDRGYVEKINKALVPTDTGDVVSTFLETNFADYISDDFTATMEDKLDLIAEGKENYKKMLTDFYKPFTVDIKKRDKEVKINNLGDANPAFKCPVCGSDMIIKLSRGGKFLSCSRYPDCDGALSMDGKEIVKNKPIGTDPETGLQIFVMDGRFGPYVQLGEMSKEKAKRGTKKIKPKMASIPKDVDPATVTVAQAMHYLALPRALGTHPTTGETITASIGRFGPYIVHEKDFRSLKTDDVYTIGLDRALEILSEVKKPRGFARKKRS